MRRLIVLLVAPLLLAGCVGQQVHMPEGVLPPAAEASDDRSAAALMLAASPPAPAPVAEKPKGAKGFELPPSLPGADAPPVVPPRFLPGTPQAKRAEAVQKAFPSLADVPPSDLMQGPALTLADLQRLATANSPVLRRAKAEMHSAYGNFIQAGLYPNPTVGYQVDQVQPFKSRNPDAGQEGVFVNYLVKTAGKVTLAQLVAGFDYLNARVALRKAEIDLAAAVRTQYFGVLMARQGAKVARSLIELADEVYRIQLRQLAAGEAAGYEPLQLFAQAAQARNALLQANTSTQGSWRQLAATLGLPSMPPAPLAGRADALPPDYELEALRARLLERHTDLASARNTLAQAETNLTLQSRIPHPDLQTNSYYQYDTSAKAFQFGVQLGVSLPIADRNQGNIHAAKATIVRAREAILVAENDLQGRLAEAFARYSSNKTVASSYREQVLPNLVRAYRGIIRRYQVEPDKVGFNDIVVAQQSLATALQSYLSALDAQWKAVSDLAQLSQLDELYP